MEPGADSSAESDAPKGVDPEDEQLDGDDEIIAVAFRRSLLAIVAVAIIGALIYFVTAPGSGPPQGDGLEAPAPQVVEASAEVTVPEIPFTDVTAAVGVDFVHRNGATGEKWLPETMGGGVAFFDYDGDGDPDLLFVSSSAWAGASDQPPSLALYANEGGRFEDRTVAAGLDRVLYGMGPAVGDFDGDGDEDLYITAVGENRLLRNDAGRFVDVTKQAGVAGAADAWSTAATFADIDGDLDLDLFVVNYVQWTPEIDTVLDFRLDGIGKAYGPPQDYRGTLPYLFRNDGGGRFSDITAESGLEVLSASGEPMAKALAILPTDVDGDGLVDFLVANDTVRNFFFHNQGEGRFVEVGELYGLAYDRNGRATGAMGVDAAHYRGDENVAFAIGNFANEMSSIYVSQDDPSFFVDEAIAEGLGAPSRRQLTFGLLFFDADLDGRQDLLQVNGHIEDRIATVDPSQSFLQPGQLFWNGGEHGLMEVTSIGDLAQPMAGRAAAYADIDGDGDLDLAVAQNGASALVLRNDQNAGHHWLRLRLLASSPVMGARVEVVTGERRQRFEVRPTRSYLAQVEPVLTIGLGPWTSVDEVLVRWPDGTETSHENLAADQLHVISP